jgi:sulfite reductase (NADPH) flavoprotein alpha-component
VKLVEARPLNTLESDKDTRAVVLCLAGSGIEYEPGDSLGIWPANNPDEVELILSILRARGAKAVAIDGVAMTAREALTRRVNLRSPSAALFTLLADHARLDFEAQRLAHLAEDDERAAGYGIHDVFDALAKFRSARPPIGPFLQSLDRLQPRLYSIASSPRRHGGEVHLTVGVVRYDLNGRGYLGLGSGFFAEHLKLGRTLPAFVQKSHGFRLPADPATPVIMVGPGTGIAPFRAFLQEREASGATGRNWLFFGDQHEAADFLYRDEIEAWRASGVLTRLSTAFSRDQATKVYVQHRMAEEAAQLWTWLCEGACFYVCGDAKRMASDVEHALAGIAASEGGMTQEAAQAWVRQLARDGRYLRDVY